MEPRLPGAECCRAASSSTAGAAQQGRRTHSNAKLMQPCACAALRPTPPTLHLQCTCSNCTTAPKPKHTCERAGATQLVAVPRPAVVRPCQALARRLLVAVAAQLKGNKHVLRVCGAGQRGGEGERTLVRDAATRAKQQEGTAEWQSRPYTHAAWAAQPSAKGLAARV